MRVLWLAIQLIPSTMNTPNTNKPQGSAKSMRWFLLMNIVIAIALVSGAAFLKNGADRYAPRAKFDRAYIGLTQQETDPAMLQKGLVYTEGARATAYRSILNLSHGTSIVWLIVAIAFIANTFFLFRINREQKKQLTKLEAA